MLYVGSRPGFIGSINQSYDALRSQTQLLLSRDFTMYLSVVLSLALVGIVVALDRLVKSRRSRLPPGPKGLPILGNILDMPKRHEWLTYTKWGREYGTSNAVVLLIDS